MWSVYYNAYDYWVGIVEGICWYNTGWTAREPACINWLKSVEMARNNPMTVTVDVASSWPCRYLLVVLVWYHGHYTHRLHVCRLGDCTLIRMYCRFGCWYAWAEVAWMQVLNPHNGIDLPVGTGPAKREDIKNRRGAARCWWTLLSRVVATLRHPVVEVNSVGRRNFMAAKALGFALNWRGLCCFDSVGVRMCASPHYHLKAVLPV